MSTLTPQADTYDDQRLTHWRHEFRPLVNDITKQCEALLANVAEGEDTKTLWHCLHEVGRASQEFLRLLDQPLASNDDEETETIRQSLRSQRRHDLLTPVNVIRGYCEFLQEDEALASQQWLLDGLQSMHAAANQCLTVLRSKPE